MNPLKLLKESSLFIFLTAFFAVSNLLGQDAATKWSCSVGMGITGNQLFGEQKDANLQYAGDQSTIFGQSARYDNPWKAGATLNLGVTRWLLKPFGISAGVNINTIRTEENLTISYSPAYFGYTQKKETVTNNLLYAVPKLGVTARWKGFGIDLGISANLFLTGKTKWQNELTKSDDSHTLQSLSGRMDTDAQPIFLDSSEVGGIVDYSIQRPGNHGANPIWFSTYLGASYALKKEGASPFISFCWFLPLQECIRSRNPSYSLRNFLQAPFDKDLNQGTMVKSFSVSLGYRF